MDGNICRCGTYSGIISAIQDAADRIREIVQQMLRITRLELVQPRPHVPEMLDLERSTRSDSPTL